MNDRVHTRFLLLLGVTMFGLLVFTALFTGETAPRAAQAAGLEPAGIQHTSAITTVGVFSNFFDPDPITITVGNTVRWTREEGTHNVTADDNSFTSGAVSSSWDTFEQTFDTPGTYPYHCDQHFLFGMAGTIVVVAGPDPTPSPSPPPPTADVFVPVLLR